MSDEAHHAIMEDINRQWTEKLSQEALAALRQQVKDLEEAAKMDKAELKALYLQIEAQRVAMSLHDAEVKKLKERLREWEAAWREARALVDERFRE